MNIHPTAIIEQGAQIDNSALIGPYCVIGKDVIIKEGVTLHSHICIEGFTEIGKNTVIFPFASIGMRPQDLKYKGENSKVLIGDDNVIREYVTIHPGTEAGSMVTKIGNRCLLMIGVHVAHDCIIGDDVIMANNASLAGHVIVEDRAILGGMSGYRQFVRIGRSAIIGGGSMVDTDVIPYGSVTGERAYLAGLNIVGMKRSNTPKSDIQQLIQAFKYIFNSKEDNTFEDRLHKALDKYEGNDMILEICNFIQSSEGKAALCFPKDSVRNNTEIG